MFFAAADVRDEAVVGELSATAVEQVRAVKVWTAQPSGNAVSQKGQIKANCLAEGAVRDCKAKVRTLNCATEKFLGVRI